MRPDGKAEAAGRFDKIEDWGNFAPPRPLTSASLRDDGFWFELGDTAVFGADGEVLVEAGGVIESERRLTVPGAGDGVQVVVAGVPNDEALPVLKGLLGLRTEGAGDDEKKFLMSERV